MDFARRQFLAHLRHVAMSGGPVGAHAPAALGVVAGRARSGSAFARARLDLDHDGFHPAAGAERREREDRGGRVAPGAGDELRAAQRIAVQLGNAVDELGQQLRARVAAAVPGVVAGRLAQPEVRAQVDDAGREPAEVVDARRRLPVGQAQEEHVAGGELGQGGELEPGGAPQIGMRAVHEAPCVALRCRLRHFDSGVPEQQPEQLPARVARSAGDGRADHRVAPRTWSTIFAGMSTPVVSMLFRNSMV